MFKRIDHVEIVTNDIEKSLSFYIDILGFKLKQKHKIDSPPLEAIVYVELNDTVLELLAMRDVTPASTDQPRVGYRMMAIEVDDMDKAIEYLKTRKVEISQEPRTMGTTKRAEIKDPNGLSIELRQW